MRDESIVLRNKTNNTFTLKIDYEICNNSFQNT